MTHPILLIAEREFRTYVATLSFWLSLAVMPVAGGILLLLSSGQPVQIPVSIVGKDAQWVRSAGLALQDAARLEGRSLVPGNGRDALVMSRPSPATLEISFSDNFPLSPVGRAMVVRTIERDAAREHASAGPLFVHEKSAAMTAAPDVARLSRLMAMVMLWLTLVGSLGMLLQAVVRERANRALESLLASARAWEITTGKMLGVGMVSLLVLASWLGSMAALSTFMPPEAGLVPAILAKLAEPLMLLRYALIYVCAFAFYGSITVALGATARDSAAAQNLVRPMFVLLLVVFFVTLAGDGSKSGMLTWLVYVPPFSPFLLLANSPDSVAPLSQGFVLGTLVFLAVGMVWVAANLLSVVPAGLKITIRSRTKPQPIV